MLRLFVLGVEPGGSLTFFLDNLMESGIGSLLILDFFDK